MNAGTDVVLGIILRLKDEASEKLQGFTQKLEENRRLMRQASTAAIIFGGALMGFALLAGKAADTQNVMGNAFAKTRSEFDKFMKTLGQGVIPVVTLFLNVLTGLTKIVNMVPAPLLQIGGAIMLIGGSMLVVFGTILKFIMMIMELRKALIALGIAQAILKALQGPVGWAQLAIGLGIAAASTAAIYGLSKMGSSTTVAATSTGATTAGAGVQKMGGAQVNVVNINAQAFTGSRQEARTFSSDMLRMQREQQRTGR